MYTLKSDRLTVQVAEPNKEDLTCRFDRAGFITSVVLDGQYEFCSEEGGGSFGKGLCSEIQCDPLSNDVAVGDTFFKFGVGILTKTEERPYMILNQYPCEDFEVTADAKDDCIVFRTEPKDCKGYAAAEQKTLRVKDNVITMDYELTNAGSKEFTFTEYVHNFVAPNHHGMDGTFNQFAIDHGDSYEWKMICGGEDLCFREVDRFIPSHTNFWTCLSAICPELFFKASLKPGETAKWTREWHFENHGEWTWNL